MKTGHEALEKLKQMRAERLDICRDCPHFIKLTNQCKKCGCLMQLKAMIPNAHCPIKKW
jgi:hypothetical protein